MTLWRVETQAATYPDLIWDDEGDRQHLIAEVHVGGIAEQIVRDHNAAIAASAAQSNEARAPERECISHAELSRFVQEAHEQRALAERRRTALTAIRNITIAAEQASRLVDTPLAAFRPAIHNIRKAAEEALATRTALAAKESS